MDSSVYISGLDDLQAALSEFTQKIQGNAMRQALYAGQKVFMAAAAANVPVSAPSGGNAAEYGAYAGALKDSLRISTYNRDGVVRAVLKAGSAKAYYAHMVEFGTAQHYITSQTGKILKFGDKFAKNLVHPGATAHPFMRPAFDSVGEQAVQAVAEYLKQRIDDERAKL